MPPLGYTIVDPRFGRRDTTHEFTIIIEGDPGSEWPVGSVAELPGSSGQARTLAELEADMRDAIEVYLESVCKQRPLR